MNLVIYHGVLAPHAQWRRPVVAYGRIVADPIHKLQRLEHQLHRAIVPRRLELHHDAAVAPEPQGS